MKNNCCTNSYSVCDPLPACMEFLVVVLPFNTNSPAQSVQLEVNQYGYSYTPEVVESDGCKYVVLDLTDLIPAGQINPYCGPIAVSFGKTFVGPDGIQYDSITFNVANISGPGSDVGTINIFNIPNFEPYV